MKLASRIAVAAGAAALACMGAFAQGYPTKTVTIVAAFPPGGTVDLLARVIGQKMTQEWKQPVIVENKPGGSGIVGSQAVMRAAPDGHTLMVVPITHVTNAALHASLPFDPIKDFTAISLIGSSPILLVANQQMPFDNVNELVAYAKANPGKLNCGSGGNGTSQHLACELFKSMAKVDIRHVPYKGNAAAMTDVIGGQIELLFDQMATAVPHVKAGKVKALAVTTRERSPALPGVPTVAESGVPGYETTAWFGMVGPAGMPRDVVAKVQGEIARATQSAEIRERLAGQGITLVGGPPAEFQAFLSDELGKWAKVVKASGAKVD